MSPPRQPYPTSPVRTLGLLAISLLGPVALWAADHDYTTSENERDVQTVRSRYIAANLPASTEGQKNTISDANSLIGNLDASGLFMDIKSDHYNLGKKLFPSKIDHIPDQHHAYVCLLAKGWYLAKATNNPLQTKLHPSNWSKALMLPTTLDTVTEDRDWPIFGSIFSSPDRGLTLLLASTDTSTFPRTTVLDKLSKVFITTLHEPYPSPYNRIFRSSFNLTKSFAGVIAHHLAQSDVDIVAANLNDDFSTLWDSLTPQGVQGVIESSHPDGSVGMHGIPHLGFYSGFYLGVGGILDRFVPLVDDLPRWQLTQEGREYLANQLLDGSLWTSTRAPDIHQSGAYFLKNPISKWGNWFVPDRANLLWESNHKLGLSGPEFRMDELQSIRAYTIANGTKQKTKIPGYSIPSRDQGKADSAWPVWPFPDRSVKIYYATDYAVKRFDRHLVSFRGISDRTLGTEELDADLGVRPLALLPLGSCFTQKDGLEYQADQVASLTDKGLPETGFTSTANTQIWPWFDFARVPGVTAKYLDDAAIKRQLINRDAWKKTKKPGGKYTITPEEKQSWYWTVGRWNVGASPFSGGLAAGRRGVYGWEQTRTLKGIDSIDPWTPVDQSVTNVGGRRAVFFLDHAVVHLNAGFDVRPAANETPVRDTYTSLDQRRSGNATTYYGFSGSETVQSYAQNATPVRSRNIAWALHDGVGYLPPSGQNTVLQDVQPAHRGIVGTNLATTTPPNIFSLWSDHGHSEANLSFSWAVVPGTTATELQQLAKAPDWIIDRNDTSIQAIHLRNADWIGAVFHQEGSYQVGSLTVAVDKPCILAIDSSGGYRRVTVADPLHSGYTRPTIDQQTPDLTDESPALTFTVTVKDATTTQEFIISPRGGAYAGETTDGPVPPSWQPAARVTYGTPLGTGQLNAIARGSGTLTYNPAADTILPAGSHRLSATFTSTDPKFRGTVTTTTTLIVDPKSLTITAPNATRNYGAANPVLTATVTGLLGSDAVNRVGVTTTATTASPAGNYDLVPGDPVFKQGKKINYKVIKHNGVLTIQNTTVTLEPVTESLTSTYDGNIHLPAFSVQPATANSALSYTYQRWDGAAWVASGTPRDAGSYRVTVSTTGITIAGNTTFDLTVLPRSITAVAPTDVVRTYGDTSPIVLPEGTIEGAVAGDHLGITCATTARPDSPVDSYEIVPSVVFGAANPANYSITAQKGTLKITDPDVLVGLKARFTFDQVLADTAVEGVPEQVAFWQGATAGQTPVFSPGLKDKGLALNAATTQRLRLTSRPEISPTGPFTLATWFQAADWNGNRRILQKGQNGEQYRLFAEGGTGSLVFEVAVQVQGRPTAFRVTKALPTTGAWHHVSAVFRGDRLELWLDQENAATAPVGGTLPLNTTVADLVIGAKLGMGGYPDTNWNGLLDELRIYDRALTEAEIKVLALPIGSN